MIDGDHSVEGVTRDFLDYRGFVRPGGLIAFHDIVERQILPGNQVFEVWKDLGRAFDTQELVEDADQYGCGLGILKVPDRWPTQP